MQCLGLFVLYTTLSFIILYHVFYAVSETGDYLAAFAINYVCRSLLIFLISHHIRIRKIFSYSWFHLYGYCRVHIPNPLFPFPPFFRFPFFSLFSRQRSPSPLRMWPQPFSSMTYPICTRAQEKCGKPVPIIPLSISMCRPRTGGHPFTYWLSARLLDFRVIV